ncbi:MAG: malate synthase G [Chloroflexota bacterium]|nr:malate synthase G [Chloroflexota bacterium]MDE2941247.1 malate synthase G [Chloroflexota bacterium]MDE3267819.1 malate synthase G [Chloroflexota bacterium]
MAQVSLDSGGTLQVDDRLYAFVRDEVVEGTGRTADEVFRILGDLVEQFGPRNRELLVMRQETQGRIDDYYREKRSNGWSPSPETADSDAEELEKFMVDIGYLPAAGPVDFRMTTPQLDAEMDQNGPELVTPVTNASMVVGGANARWGSLYDAYFLSDVHPEIDRDTQRPARLRMVVEETNAFLDEHVAAWADGVRFDDVTRYSVARGAGGRYELVAQTRDEREARLQEPDKFIGFNLGGDGQLADFYLTDNGLRVQIQLYEGGAVDSENGQFRDLVVESALTNIIDFEDAVTVVDAEDQVAGLRNYLGVIRGDLQAFGSRGNLKTINSDRTMTDPDGNACTLKGTSLMSVRNVSLHMYTNGVTLNGEEVPERMVGLLLTSLIATSHDKGSSGEDRAERSGPMPVRGPNSSKGFVYQVTPKLCTAEEVAEQMRLFEAIEERLGLASGTILIGIMNEELGMTLQLADALQASQSRTFFINTGFLDRTGSQIRVQMQAGPVDVRDDLTAATYNTSYERHNVDVGIQTGIHKSGKIGKGMQVRNRAMAEMLQVKINHPRTGGNTAWVPAPYPSDLHSMHYHMVDVDEVQQAMEDSPALNIGRNTLLTFPLLDASKVSDADVKESLVMRYVHSMLAYAEPWVNRGIGCSGVANFDRVEEMKDRATERIDSAVLANWRLHEVISQADIERALAKVAEILDEQNASLEGYEPLADTPEKRERLLTSPAIVSVLEVIDEAASSPSAFVEPGLFRNRRAVKSAG